MISRFLNVNIHSLNHKRSSEHRKALDTLMYDWYKGVSEWSDGNITKIIFHLNLIAVYVKWEKVVKRRPPKRISRDFNTPRNAVRGMGGWNWFKKFPFSLFLHEKRNKSNAWRCFSALPDDIYEIYFCNFILKEGYEEKVLTAKENPEECFIRAYDDNNDEIILMFFSNQVLWCERLFKLDSSHILNTLLSLYLFTSARLLQLTAQKKLSN